jgi:hypothetical protein
MSLEWRLGGAEWQTSVTALETAMLKLESRPSLAAHRRKDRQSEKQQRGIVRAAQACQFHFIGLRTGRTFEPMLK